MKAKTRDALLQLRAATKDANRASALSAVNDGTNGTDLMANLANARADDLWDKMLGMPKQKRCKDCGQPKDAALKHIWDCPKNPDRRD